MIPFGGLPISYSSTARQQNIETDLKSFSPHRMDLGKGERKVFHHFFVLKQIYAVHYRAIAQAYVLYSGWS